jgi:hypothetical protein
VGGATELFSGIEAGKWVTRMRMHEKMSGSRTGRAKQNKSECGMKQKRSERSHTRACGQQGKQAKGRKTGCRQARETGLMLCCISHTIISKSI